MARGYDVAVMHDFFVDRLLHAEDIDRLASAVKRKVNEGGGGIQGFRQEEVRGGNAVNLASALARLGLRTLLITHSDPAHEGMLRSGFAGVDADVRVKAGRPGLTVAFEGKTNVMLADAGGAGEFGPERLDASDWRALESSRLICVVNWAANRKGTRLVSTLREKLGTEKAIYLDPADFRGRLREFSRLLRGIAKKKLVDWVSMNEPEAVAAATMLGLRARGLGRTCQAMAERLDVKFDLHSATGSYSSDNGGSVAFAKAGRVRARRRTGAGDVWDAGAIFGGLGGMHAEERLAFANRAAGLYLSSADGEPPSLAQVLVGR